MEEIEVTQTPEIETPEAPPQVAQEAEQAPQEADQLSELAIEEILGDPDQPEPSPELAEDTAHLRAMLEAVIYITDEPLTLQQICAALAEPIDKIKRLLDDLVAEYDKPGKGLSIREVAGGYKMATKAEHHEAVRAFVKKLTPPLKLSLAALETLAVIAYKQPVTAPEIMDIRGVQGAGVLKTLLDRKLIHEGGRKKVIGQPILYKTTKDFLVQFGLKDLTELPTLKEFEELGRMELVEEVAEAAEAATEPQAMEAAAEAATASAATEDATEPSAAEATPESDTSEATTEPTTVEVVTESPASEDATKPSAAEAAPEPDTSEAVTEPEAAEATTVSAEEPTIEPAADEAATELATESVPPSAEEMKENG